MKDTLMNREELKLACLALLDDAAVEHPSGHQGKLAARYILRSVNGERIELMFEKGAKSPANLWVAQKYVSDLLATDIEARLYPSLAVDRVVKPDGERLYGRHSALKSMRGLVHANLVRFTVKRVSQIEMILERLVAT